MKKIKLSQGKCALVDDEDFEYLIQWKWSLSSDGYAVRNTTKNNEKRTTLRMHRVINKTPYGFETDHKNGCRIDNRKCNLRTATKSQNGQNRRLFKPGTSKWKGVSWHNKNRRWRTQIKVSGEIIHIGEFKNELEAAKVYDQAAIKHHGKFARLNFQEKKDVSGQPI